MNTLLIWDDESLLDETAEKVALWRSYSGGVSPDIVSIPALVEQNAVSLKKKYLARIYDLGEEIIDSSRLVDHLELRTGFSYWWMSLAVEKCNYSRSPQIVNAFKLMAFENWAEGLDFNSIKLVSKDPRLAMCLEAWCRDSEVAFEWQKVSSQAETLMWHRQLYRALPLNVSALAWLLRYLVKRWPLKGVGLEKWTSSDSEVTFVSYLYNLDSDRLAEGNLKSSYWAHLPETLLEKGCKTSWLHTYIESPSIPNAISAARAIRSLNATGQNNQVHVTLDTFLGWKVVWGTLRDWLFLSGALSKLTAICSRQQHRSITLWPLFSEDWRRSLLGSESLSNLLHLNLYEAALQALPIQRTGVYLQENQGWEASLVYAWKVFGHGCLIGAPNASVRFWDLRYFFDPRTYDNKRINSLPVPDLVAVNGPAAKDAYLKGGYPEANLVTVEALRYLSINAGEAESSKISVSTKDQIRLLVMGDYLHSNTRVQMRLLEQAALSGSKNLKVLVKPHPSCPIQPADYPRLDFTVTTDSLSNLLSNCDVAYSSSLTAASLDAYCAGVPVISVLDPNQLNMSPLRGQKGGIFISTSEELENALTQMETTTEDRAPFFQLDPSLLGWMKLLIDKGRSY